MGISDFLPAAAAAAAGQLHRSQLLLVVGLEGGTGSLDEGGVVVGGEGSDVYYFVSLGNFLFFLFRICFFFWLETWGAECTIDDVC